MEKVYGVILMKKLSRPKVISTLQKLPILLVKTRVTQPTLATSAVTLTLIITLTH